MDGNGAVIGKKDIKIEFTGVRPGEKIHEILISEEEGHRAYDMGDYYIIKPILPEIFIDGNFKDKLNREYSSSDVVLSYEDTEKFLESHRLLIADNILSWSRLSDSNRPPTVYKTVALPDELRGHGEGF